MVDSAETDEPSEELRALGRAASTRIDREHARATLRERMFGKASSPVEIGRFEIVRRIGSGGMGVVYEVRDPTSDERLAVKTLHRVDPQRLYRLKREFRVIAEVSHPNLVQLYDLYTEGEETFFSMELIDGVDVLEYVRGAPDPAAAVRDVVLQLASVLGHLHGIGKLHLDVKPSNVLVTDAGRVVLLDFGLARDVRPDAVSRSVDAAGGTPAYMAPEQAHGTELSPATDLYALGVLLYTALCGRTPFEGLDLAGLLDAKGRGAPQPPSAVGPGVPPDLDRLSVALLHPDPNRRPDVPEILERLGAHAREPTPTSGPEVFVGRSAELERLRRAHDRSLEGAPVVVHVEGPSGVGKSSLLRRFLTSLDPDTVVLSGRCYEREFVPYRGVDGLMDSLSRYLSRLDGEAVALLPRHVRALAGLFPVLMRVPGIAAAPLPRTPDEGASDRRHKAVGALRELLGRISDRHPLVLFVDDLQWGDLDSARLLGDLMRGGDVARCLLICCYRSEGQEANPVIQEIRRLPGARAATAGQLVEIRLGPLSAGESTELARHLLGPDTSLAPEIAREGDGHPFLVTELARHASGRGTSPSTEVTLEEMLGARVEALDPTTRRLLSVVAIAAAPVPRIVAATVARLDDRAGRSGVHQLMTDRLIRADGGDGAGGLTTYHDRVREVVVASLPSSERAALHLRLALSLEEQGDADLAVLTHHFHLGGDVALAARYAVRAADRSAGQMAFDRAAAMYRLALDLGAPDGQEGEVRLKMAESLRDAGQPAAAADAYLAAIDRSAASELDLRRMAADVLLGAGHLDRGLEQLRHVMEAVGLKLPESRPAAAYDAAVQGLRLRLRGNNYRMRDASEVPPALLAQIDVCATAALKLGYIDPVLVLGMHYRQVRLALQAGEPTRLAKALAAHAVYGRPNSHSSAESLRLLEQAWSIVRAHPDPIAEAVCALAEASLRMYRGEFAAAVESADASARLFRANGLGDAWLPRQAELIAEPALVWIGEAREVQERAARGLEVCLASQDMHHAFIRRVSVLANFCHLADDDPDAAEHTIALAQETWHGRGFQVNHQLVNQSLARVHLYRGDSRQAFELVHAPAPLGKRLLLQRHQWLRIWSRYVQGQAAVADWDHPGGRSPALLRKAVRSLAGEGMDWVRGLQLPLRAAAAFRGGDPDTAVRFLERALAIEQARQMTLWTHFCERQLGILRGRPAEVAEAERRIRDRGIRRPDFMARVWLPGFE